MIKGQYITAVMMSSEVPNWFVLPAACLAALARELGNHTAASLEKHAAALAQACSRELKLAAGQPERPGIGRFRRRRLQ
jgi:hypothetical protein